MKYIDIHTHDRKAEKGVLKVINISVNDDIATDSGDENIFTMGVHPWEIEDIDVNENIEKIEHRIKKGDIKGIGEAGLDGIKGPDIEIQEDVFGKLIHLSEEHRLPLTVHCVKRYNEILLLRKNLKPVQKWLIHSFNSSVQMMRQMVNTGIFISLGPALLKGNSGIADLCRNVPEESLLLETDDSGSDIRDIYQKVSEFRNIPVGDLKKLLYENYLRIFG